MDWSTFGDTMHDSVPEIDNTSDEFLAFFLNPRSGAATPTTAGHLGTAEAFSPGPSFTLPLLNTLSGDFDQSLQAHVFASSYNPARTIEDLRLSDFGAAAVDPTGATPADVAPTNLVSNDTKDSNDEELGFRKYHRSAKACERCRRQKMRCIGCDNPPCASQGPLTPRSPHVLPADLLGPVASFVTPEEVADLFVEFYRHINPSWALLDEDYHTAQMVGEKSPLLLLTIVTITSRFHKPTKHLYPQLYQKAREDAAAMIIDGERTIETVQAFLFLAMWAVHPSGSLQDLGWLLICFASRLASDLGLQRKRPPSNENDASEQLVARDNANRLRTWMLCYSLDRSYSLQRGRVATLSCQTSEILLLSARACREQPRSVGIAAYCELQALASEALDALQWGDPSAVDFGAITSGFEEKVCGWKERLTSFLKQPETIAAIPPQQLLYFFAIFDFYKSYWCLVVFSFGLQNSLDVGSTEVAYYFFKCAGYASGMLLHARNKLATHEYFQCAPDSRFVFLTYAAVCLIKFSRPEFQRFCMPAICAQFLRSLVRETGRTSMTVPISPTAHANRKGKSKNKDLDQGSEKVAPLVGAVLEPGSWQSMVMPGFDGRERPSTSNFLRSALAPVTAV
ncbi:hypothetical protein MNV49_005899 [Pseudohyphozyma bogoriensis]|nr:hypothetical protein MNV49_005899 [Pseudohyphozyma bogoriensis]